MSQGLPAPVFGVFSGVVDSTVVGTAHAGMCVYAVGAGKLGKAINTSAGPAAAVGLLPRATVAGDVAAVVYAGPLTLEATQWNDSISDEAPDGLTPGKVYYVGGVAGKITKVKPGRAQQLGLAISQTTLLVNLTGPFAVQGS